MRGGRDDSDPTSVWARWSAVLLGDRRNALEALTAQSLSGAATARDHSVSL